MAHSKEKIIIKTVPEKDLMADVVDKDFKTTVLMMLEEIKKNVEKIKKMNCKQNGNINKEIEPQRKTKKKNSEAEKHDN